MFLILKLIARLPTLRQMDLILLIFLFFFFFLIKHYVYHKYKIICVSHRVSNKNLLPSLKSIAQLSTFRRSFYFHYDLRIKKISFFSGRKKKERIEEAGYFRECIERTEIYRVCCFEINRKRNNVKERARWRRGRRGMVEGYENGRS